jgi:acetylornithine/succinyldiaminopimelate/putrescine aminotransferase/predicted amino acid dehydrogenase
MQSLYSTHTRPELARVLKKLRLDNEIIAGAGKYLTIRKPDGTEEKVLDLIAGYGSCVLGHNHPELVGTMINVLQGNRVNHAQLSMREKAGQLSAALHKVAEQETGKSFITTLANSGAEAVEAAMKHALMGYHNKIQAFIANGEKVFNLKQGREKSQKLAFLKKAWLEKVELTFKNNPGVFLALEGGFHGKTLGALSLTYNESYRAGFSGSLLKCRFLNPSVMDIETVSSEFAFEVPYPEINKEGELIIKEKQWLPFVAFFAEPIQGEAGVFPLSAVQAREIRRACDALQIPLVWDEIQSGCYRTGTLFAASQLQVPGDYYLLGKSLGGGLVKISALMVDEQVYIEKFGMVHTSTYAEDDLSSMVATRFLELAEKQAADIEMEGEVWKGMFSLLQATHPTVIKEVRGKGLLWGVEFNDFNLSACYGFQALSRGGYFNYLLSAWMMHHHNIRLSAPLSNGFTLRMHPPQGCSHKEVRAVKTAFDQLCTILKCEDFYALIAFLLPEEWQAVREYPLNFAHGKIQYESPESNSPCVGFISHYINEATLAETSPSLSCLPLEIIEELLEGFLDMASAVMTGSRIVNAGRQKVHLTMIGAPFTSGMAKRAIETKTTGTLRNSIIKGVTMLEKEVNPSVIGLGQYTSILCNNGMAVSAAEGTITTGNGYTAYHAADALMQQCNLAGVNSANEKLAVFGAGGNIGAVICALLLPFVKELYLFGNPANVQKVNLKFLKEELTAQYPEKKIVIAQDVSEAKDCRLVIAATNQPTPFLNDANLHAEAIICDLSVPINICPEILENPGSRRVVQGGVANVPDGKAIPSKGFPLLPGKTFACLAETLILGLADKPEMASLGPLATERVKALGMLAKKFGFSEENGIDQYLALEDERAGLMS